MTNVHLGCAEWVSLGSAQARIRRSRIQRGTAERRRRGLERTQVGSLLSNPITMAIRQRSDRVWNGRALVGIPVYVVRDLSFDSSEMPPIPDTNTLIDNSAELLSIFGDQNAVIKNTNAPMWIHQTRRFDIQSPSTPRHRPFRDITPNDLL